MAVNFNIKENPVIGVFEKQALSLPDKIAIVHNEKKIDYKTLFSLSRHYSHALSYLELKQGDVIGIECRRSIESIALLLACARIGVIFVPLDKNYCPHRREQIYLDCEPKIVVTDEVVEQSHNAINLETLFNLVQSEDVKKQKKKYINPEHPLCILYTSGSTGVPKGVVRSHKAVFSQIRFLLTDEKQSQTETVAQISSFSFVPSLIQIFGSLGTGATITIIDEEYKRDAEVLILKCNKDGVTKISLVPSHLEVLLNTIKTRKKELTTIKRISCTGEYLSDALIKKHFDLHPNIKLVNTYGSTECGGVGWCEYTKDSATTKGFSLYPHVNVSIVDDGCNASEINKRGQIAISSPAVGYYYCKHATKPKIGKEEYFLTGDFGFLDKEKKLVLLGRNDDQVKINSQRINLEEINVRLREYPGIEKSVVLKSKSNENKTIFYFSSMENISPYLLKLFAKKELPHEFVPLYYINVVTWPLLPNGKIDRRSLPNPTVKDMGVEAKNIIPNNNIELKIYQLWADILGLEKTSFGIENNFFDLGGTSLLLMKLATELSKVFPDIEVSITDLFKYPSIRGMATYYRSREKNVSVDQVKDDRAGEASAASFKDIAIIGMACRFPGAKNIEEYWDNLKNGVESIRFLNNEGVKERQIYAQFSEPADKIIPAVSEIEDIDKFDNSFFEITAAEAKILDPQHRVLLEVVWHALEDAGYTEDNLALKKGVFVGASDSKYFINNILLNGVLNTKQDQNFAHLLNSTQFLATRIAYKINTKGPAVTINTACSTSLVAVAMACESIRTGQSDIAIAGGVSLVLPDEQLSVYQPGSILSSDGSCRPFDVNASGTILGSGVGVVILKSLEKAVRDNDNILAVIKGVGINNDGSRKMGFAAPSEQGQVECMIQALTEANISLDSIGYIEAHGTGTKLGDPIEFSALKEVMSLPSSRKNMCALGSVKGNIGHANVAAGVAGLIKTVLCLKHNKLVPSINFKEPNPLIDLKNSPFYINTQTINWERFHDAQPLRAGVTSLGMGGTNAHIILEEAPPISPSNSNKDFHILTFSARAESSLQALMKNVLHFMEKQKIRANPNYSIGNLEYSLWTGRKKFPCRATIVCRTHEEGISLLRNKIEEGEENTCISPNIGFLFPKNVDVRLVIHLYNNEKIYKKIFDACLYTLETRTDFYSDSINFIKNDNKLHLKDGQKEQSLNFLSEFIAKYSLANFIKNLGVQPSFFAGDDKDKLVAACIADVISFNDAIGIIRDNSITTKSPFILYNYIQVEEKKSSFTVEEHGFLEKGTLLNICSSELFTDFFQNSEKLNETFKKSNIQNLFEFGFLFDFYHTLAQLWTIGIDIKLEKIIERENRISLPQYPFLKTSHWIPKERSMEKIKIVSQENEVPQSYNFTITETKLFKIWKNFFREEDLNIDSNFYDLGGHSLLAIQLVSQINTELGIDFLMSDILENSSIRKLASFIDTYQTEKKISFTEKDLSNDEENFPLSFGQQKMWMLDKIYPSEGICAVPVAFKIKGEVDVLLMEKAISIIIKNNSVLRTKFFKEDGILKQKIGGGVPFTVREESLHDSSQLNRTLKKYVAIPFDLEKPPLFRIVSIKLKNKRTILLFVFHHIIIDSWSLGLFWKELQSTYFALEKNEIVLFNQNAASYKDFVTHQQNFIKNEKFEQQLNYWGTQLKGLVLTSIPKKNILKEAPRTHQVKNFTWEIRDPDLLTVIDETCALNQCTRFVFFYSIFILLLFYYSGNEDVAVFSLFANRKRKKEEEIIGLFSTPHILRLNIESTENIAELLLLAKKTILEALDNQDVPFETIKEKYFPNENMELLVSTLFLFHESHLANDRFIGREIEQVLQICPPGIQQELSLEVNNKGSCLQFNFVYQKDLFDPVIIQQLAENYEELIKTLVAFPQKFIKSVTLSNKNYASEKNQLLSNLPSVLNTSDYPLEKSICDLFERTASQYPDKISLINDIGEEMSFSELSSEVNSLAFYLKSQGIQAGDKVGISFPPSFSLISGILAILKIGAIYLPLDPLYPSARLSYYLKHSQTKWVLTNKDIHKTIFSELEPNVKCLFVEDFKVKPDVFFNNINSDVATILYTSGSTGDPKGVIINQKSIINRCYWFKNFYGWPSTSVGCLSTTINFVDSIAEMFECLLFGAKLLVVDRGKVSNVKTFVKLIKKYKVSKLVLVPSFLNLILTSGINKAYLNTLKFLTCSGEALPLLIAKAFLKAYPNVKLLNFYGSTEVMADVTSYEVSHQDVGMLPSIPIGKPISNVAIHVLNKYKTLLPAGAMGEIYVGGDCLAAGYLNNEQKTKESFVEISVNDTKILSYNTKDKGYFLPNGNIVYSGRFDNIIKLNGNTVDLSEVENCLKNNKLVERAAVLLKEEGENKNLIAYVIPANPYDSHYFIKNKLFAQMREELPRYTIPSLIILLDTLPLMANGKLNKIELLKCTSLKNDNIAVPLNATQTGILAIWEDILKTSQINTYDSFFEVGGTSLLAIRLILEIEKSFSVTLELSDIIKNPTIEGIENLIIKAQNEKSSILPFNKNLALKTSVVAFHPITGLGVDYVRLEPYLSPHRLTIITYPFGTGMEFNNIEGMVSHYLTNLPKVHKDTPLSLLGYSMGGILALEAAYQLTMKGYKVNNVVMVDTYYPDKNLAKKERIVAEAAKLQERLFFSKVSENDINNLMPIIINNMHLLSKYRPKQYVGPINFLKSANYSSSMLTQWKRNLKNFTIYDLPGDHYSIFEDQNIHMMADFILDILTPRENLN